MPAVTLGDIYAARDLISSVVVRTPLQPYLGAEVPAGNTLWLKCENLQRTASFKMRGAFNAVASLSESDRDRGVITYSSGNHGQAVACAAHILGIEAVVVMPEDAVAVKVGATRRWGAEVVFAGRSSIDREEYAMELARSRGYTVIPPFDDGRIIAGQGTTGLEILEQLPNVEAVVVPIGGGGLMSGIATAVKSLQPHVRVIGVEPANGADAQASFRTGSLVTLSGIDTLADGLRTSRLGNLNFRAICEFVDDIVTVSEEDILRVMGLLLREAKLVVEPSGAVAPAALLCGVSGLENARAVAVISGGNVEPERMYAAMSSTSQAASVLR